MGGRYKNVNGQAVWEELPEGVNAPNQIEPPGANAAPGGAPSSTPPPPPPDAGGWGRPGSPTPGQRPGPITPPPGGFEFYPPQPDSGMRNGPAPMPPGMPRTSGPIIPGADTAGGIAGGPSPEPTPMQEMGQKGPRLNPGDPGYGIPGQPGATPAATGSTTPTPPAGDMRGNRNAFRDALLATGGRTVADLQAFVQANPQYGVTLRGSKGDKVYGPNGEFWADVVISAGEGGRGFYWGDSTGPSAGAGGAGSFPGGGDFNSMIRSALLGQMGQASAPVTGSDPIISAQMEAQGNILERNRRDRRAADAERAAMNGLLSGGQSSGSFEQNVASGFEDKANAQTGLLADLMGREQQARRTQMVQLLQMAIQTGDADLERSLRWQLAQMDLAFQRDRWNDDFGLRASEVLYGRDRDLAGYGGGL